MHFVIENKKALERIQKNLTAISAKIPAVVDRAHFATTKQIKEAEVTEMKMNEIKSLLDIVIKLVVCILQGYVMVRYGMLLKESMVC